MNVALIFAGGVGKRMQNQGLPKQFMDIFGKPVIIRTLDNFQNNSEIDEIYIVMLGEYIQYTADLVKQHNISKVKSIVGGGENGQSSIYNGLYEIKRHHINDNPIVLIHDGVRPIIEKDLIQRNIQSVQEFGSAISSVPAHETEIIVANNYVERIVDRNTAQIARAPQSFFLDDIFKAHEVAKNNNDYSMIDSCSMMKKYSDISLHTVPTIPENIKITTPMDYHLVKTLFSIKESYETSIN